jgi:tRNA nucleotidyltransferase (CCA-adding enzyme)
MQHIYIDEIFFTLDPLVQGDDKETYMFIQLPLSVQKIIDTLRSGGFECYAVGGSIRDLLMNRTTKSWDMTTNAKPEEILQLFPDSFYDNAFGTVGIKIYKQNDKFQISNDKSSSNDKIQNICHSKRSEESQGDVASRSFAIAQDDNTTIAQDDNTTIAQDDNTTIAQDDNTTIAQDDNTTIAQDDNTTIAQDVASDKPDDIYEITTYRSEQGYSDYRHPDKIIWGTTLLGDLSRRDFTINAIAFDGKTIVDPYHGQEDIKKKIIKAVGDPKERFKEDALRMIRAVRIASEIGFMIDEPTRIAMKSHAPLIHEISRERIGAELLKLLKSEHPADGVLLMRNSGLLKEILPELDRAFETPQKSPERHHIYDVGTHSVEALRNCPSTNPIVRLATLLHDIGKVKTFYKHGNGLITFHNHEMESTKQCKIIADRLRLSNKQKDLLINLVRWHQFSVDERQTDSAIRRIIRRVGVENLDNMLALRIGDRLGGGATETSWRLELFKKRLQEVQIQPFSVSDLKVSGHDVMEFFNIKPGPKVGDVLNTLFKEVEDGKLKNEREKLMKKMGELK